MPAPAFVTVTKGQAVEVATAVVTGQIHKVKPGSPGAEYFHTYVPTGEAAPTTFNEFRGGKIFIDGDTEIISANEQIDVYFWLTGGENGEVRVDV
jgi:hypothetical protein